jgi:urea carboxylase
MFDKVLIANRGAIACRIIRTLRRLKVRSVAVYSDADRHARHVAMADEAVRLGPAPAAESYLKQDLIIAAARELGAQAIHPGYGFLSENAAFAERCEAAGLAFIGPTPEQIRRFGLKHSAREIALAEDVPLLPGSGLLADVAEARAAAARIGYPVMLKCTAGGGGIGMQLCTNDAELTAAFAAVERLAQMSFSQGGLFLEKFVPRARHIEVQIFGDGRGNVVALGERDCSVQRRNQKVIEETPAPRLAAQVRERLLACAERLGRAVAYRSAGTVEFVYDDETEAFYFLEVNTRLQVEHGVTEEVTGIDLVEWMVRTAAGDLPDLSRRPAARGHSLQARLYAEDPANGFRPSSGLLSNVELPDDVRVDHWIETGCEVSSFYDPMLAKVIATAEDRAAALARLEGALAATRIDGIETNLAFLRAIVAHERFREGRQFTRWLNELAFRPSTIEVLQPGTHTTVQDFPGRVGYWDIGVPPSGPMDDLAFRLANRLVGNAEGAAGLELTATGPTLKFNCARTIALAGAPMQAELVSATGDKRSVPLWTAVKAEAGSILKLKRVQGAGQRTYLAVQGGIDVPLYLGSRATFTLGQFGGHAGRALRAGDVLHLCEPTQAAADGRALPPDLIPQYTHEWTLRVMYGPHGAPDFFTPEDIETFFATSWEVHYNSSRTGVRLIGPKPKWARADGGEAGLHPSNIHDNAYAIGAIDFTGDMPVILGPDGPSLGGFVCPATIVRADLWKVGQLRPGDKVRFVRVSFAEARALDEAQNESIRTLSVSHAPATPMLRMRRAAGKHDDDAVLLRLPQAGERPAVCYRQAGDCYLLVEYGENVLDLALRFRVHALMEHLNGLRMPGLRELTPGIRSLQVHFDPQRLSQRELLAELERAESALAAIDDVEVPSRIVHLPLSWDDPATRLAIEKYMQSVRKDAPWCPSNLEFIRRVNGLDSIEDVRRIVFDASYLVMGLGDVYLGAPVATPLDPRHRLVTTKYNPARTWTPENAVGIGGAYLCIYGMEGPGGYQFVGRTVQMWNRYRQTQDFIEGKPWLLRFFDQIRFFPVTAEELLTLRDEFPRGRYKLEVEETVLSLKEYRNFLATHADSIAAFKARQHAAFEAERERWRSQGQLTFASDVDLTADEEGSAAVPAGTIAITAPVSGSIWQVSAEPGHKVREAQELFLIEAMKMEIPILADETGELVEVRVRRGATVRAGDVLAVIRPEQQHD